MKIFSLLSLAVCVAAPCQAHALGLPGTLRLMLVAASLAAILSLVSNSRRATRL